MLIIGLTGRAGAGKDTVATLLLQQLPGQRYAFADPLRAEAAAAFGVEPALFADRDAKERPHEALRLSRCADEEFAEVLAARDAARRDQGLSPRQVLQWWGTDYRRAQSPGYWLALATRHLEQLRTDGCPLLVVTDVRFPNEAAWIRSHGGELWRVLRGVPSVHTHISESALDGWPADVLLRNDDSLEALRRLVVDLAADLA